MHMNIYNLCLPTPPNETTTTIRPYSKSNLVGDSEHGMTINNTLYNTLYSVQY